MIRIIVLFLFSTSLAFADNNKYWNISVPTISGATEVSRERNDRFYSISTKYNIQLSETESVYKFYNEYFEKLGWVNPMKKYKKNNKNIKGNWSTYRFNSNAEGYPVAIYASVWKAKTLPAIGTVGLSLTSYKEGKFNAEVSVDLAPEVDTSTLFTLQKLIMKDPRNIFILYEATGANPLEFDKVSPKPKKEYKNKIIVKEYYRLLNGIKERYKEFGRKYIYK